MAFRYILGLSLAFYFCGGIVSFILKSENGSFRSPVPENLSKLQVKCSFADQSSIFLLNSTSYRIDRFITLACELRHFNVCQKSKKSEFYKNPEDVIQIPTLPSIIFLSLEKMFARKKYRNGNKGTVYFLPKDGKPESGLHFRRKSCQNRGKIQPTPAISLFSH